MSHVYVQAHLDHDPDIHTSLEARKTGARHQTQLLLVEARAGHKLWASQSMPPKQLGLQACATESSLV
jgi:hypothetical protein